MAGSGVLIKLKGAVEAGGYGSHSVATGLAPGQLRARFDVEPRASYLGKEPGTVEEIAGVSIDDARFAEGIVRAYAEARPDFISSGAITHSAAAVDINCGIHVL